MSDHKFEKLGPRDPFKLSAERRSSRPAAPAPGPPAETLEGDLGSLSGDLAQYLVEALSEPPPPLPSDAIMGAAPESKPAAAPPPAATLRSPKSAKLPAVLLPTGGRERIVPSADPFAKPPPVPATPISLRAVIPTQAQPVVHAPPVHAPPVHAPPVHAPPVHAQAVPAPAVHAPPVHAPPVYAPPPASAQAPLAYPPTPVAQQEAPSTPPVQAPPAPRISILRRPAPRPTGQAQRVDRFLKLMQDRGASDLHMSVGRPPIFRLSGVMDPIRYRTLTEGDFDRFLEPITPPALWTRFKECGDVDFAYQVPELARFRVNLFRQERGPGAVFRIIPTRLMTVDQLGLPASVRTIANLRSGLVLVTGPTGSGKSTTLSAIIHEMNRTRPLHIITLEDPIEFVHPNQMSLVSQREVGAHTRSFAPALRAALREDPDLILVGEMRDLETIEMAVTAAGTGLMVFGTLHTNSASKALDRIINVFPSDRQDGVRGALANGVRAVVAQQLLQRKQGGRVAAIEVLFSNPALASNIRDGKTHQISGLIQAGKNAGMIAMDDALRKLVEEDRVLPLHALEKALDKDYFRKWLKSRGDEVPAETGEEA